MLCRLSVLTMTYAQIGNLSNSKNHRTDTMAYHVGQKSEIARAILQYTVSVRLSCIFTRLPCILHADRIFVRGNRVNIHAKRVNLYA